MRLIVSCNLSVLPDSTGTAAVRFKSNQQRCYFQSRRINQNPRCDSETQRASTTSLPKWEKCNAAKGVRHHCRVFKLFPLRRNLPLSGDNCHLETMRGWRTRVEKKKAFEKLYDRTCIRTCGEMIDICRLWNIRLKTSCTDTRANDSNHFYVYYFH